MDPVKAVSRDLQVLIQLQPPAILFLQMTRKLSVDAYHLIALAAGFLNFALQALDVPLAFPEQVGALMNIQEPARGRDALDRAHCQKKVRILSGTSHAIHARIDRRKQSLRIEGDRFDVILQENSDAGEELCQCGLELSELKFVSVKRVGALRPARFGVVQLVGRRDEENALRRSTRRASASRRRHSDRCSMTSKPVTRSKLESAKGKAVAEAARKLRFGWP